MTEVEGNIDRVFAPTSLVASDVVDYPVPSDATDTCPSFLGTVDLDPEDAIMQRVSAICLSGLV